MEVRNFVAVFATIISLFLSGCKPSDKTWWEFLEILVPKFESLPKKNYLDESGLDFIVYYETGGQSYYNKHLKYPTVPPGDSGCTIGVGYDLRFYSKENIQKDWYKLESDEKLRLSLASGLNHYESQKYLPKIKDILIEWGLATEVFNNVTVPDYYELALKTFPGMEDLKVNAQTALTSLVFNRGSSMVGPSRTEMKEVRDAVATKDYQEMADATIRMKRLWRGKGMDGLLKRRDAEAKLFLSCL